VAEHIWYCKIGGEIPDEVWEPDGEYMAHDFPMRRAIEEAYYNLFGSYPEFIFSGWAAELTEPERAVVENRLPREE